ncbi:hypothetical protein ACGYJ8_18595 [Sulfitobacter sp. 1A12126]|uniref:hypothetical protein n=1 Tax=Sulfitobacter sp. 1A12126 TaxID=3368591 RepID=UPI00374746C3
MYWLKQIFTRPKTHLWALIEVLITLVMAILPFLTYYAISAAQNEGAEASDFWGFVDRGQLFLLSYGLFGPVIWLSFVKPDVARHDARILLGVISILIVFPVVGFMGVDPTFSTVQNETIVSISYWFYGVFLFVNYLLIFYCTIEPPTAEDSLSKGSKSMKDRYDEEYGNG